MNHVSRDMTRVQEDLFYLLQEILDEHPNGKLLIQETLKEVEDLYGLRTRLKLVPKN